MTCNLRHPVGLRHPVYTFWLWEVSTGAHSGGGGGFCDFKMRNSDCLRRLSSRAATRVGCQHIVYMMWVGCESDVYTTWLDLKMPRLLVALEQPRCDVSRMSECCICHVSRVSEWCIYDLNSEVEITPAACSAWAALRRECRVWECCIYDVSRVSEWCIYDLSWLQDAKSRLRMALEQPRCDGSIGCENVVYMMWVGWHSVVVNL